MDPETQKLIGRGVSEIIPKEETVKLLESGRKLRVKFGIDPNLPEIHLGHAVAIRKLKQFQRSGHQIVFIVGDYTARIGDPSGKDKTRPSLNETEIKKNADNYFGQAFKILDKNLTEVHLQSEWFSGFDLAKIIDLTSKISVEQVLAHETFRLRIEKKQPFMIHEELYPLLQGYDSVAVKADIEIGGVDQKFNLLMGRQIQKAYGMHQQSVITMNYLRGTDGKMKMSKSLSNYIALNDPPAEMYAKVMSIPDELIVEYFELATDITEDGLKNIKKELKEGKNPKDIKSELAKLIVKLSHSSIQAKEAQAEFERVFKERKIPSKIPTTKLSGKMTIKDVLVRAKLADSGSQAQRLIEQGGVKVNNKVLNDWTKEIELTAGTIIQIGKRKFIKIS